MMRRLTVLLSAIALLATVACDKKDASSEPNQGPSEKVASQESTPPADESAESPGDKAGDEVESADTAEDQQPALEKSLLWRVKSEHGPVFLFGTVHGGVDANWEQFPSDVRRALEQSDLVVLEADIANAGGQAMKLREKMVYSGEKTLESELGEEAFGRLADLIGKPEIMIQRMRPWVVYSELVRAWLPPGRAVDEIVQGQGEARGKEFAFIETIPEQVEILASAVTVEVLRDTIRRADEMKQDQDELIQAYMAGDAEKIERHTFDQTEMERFPELYEALFDRRNEAWMSDIEGYIERGNVFVAVGVGHLVGDGGLVARLDQRGYDVVRTAETD